MQTNRLWCLLKQLKLTHSLSVALETLVGFWPHQPASSILFCCSLSWYLSLSFLHPSLLDLFIYFLVCQLVFSLLLCYSINLLLSHPFSSKCVPPISVFYLKSTQIKFGSTTDKLIHFMMMTNFTFVFCRLWIVITKTSPSLWSLSSNFWKVKDLMWPHKIILKLDLNFSHFPSFI